MGSWICWPGFLWYGTDRFLLVHIEIEARARRGMGTRLRDYQRAIQGRHEDPVLSIVVYLKGGQGGICEQGLDGDLTAPGLTSFRYLSFGLSRCSAAEYLARPEPLAWALAALMERGEWSRAELETGLSEPDFKKLAGPRRAL